MAQIKSGTNNLRGSAFEYHTNEKADRKLLRTGRTHKGMGYKQYGGTLGGPIVHTSLLLRQLRRHARPTVTDPALSVPTEACGRGTCAGQRPDLQTRSPAPQMVRPHTLREQHYPGGMIDPDGPASFSSGDASEAEPARGDEITIRAGSFILNRWTVDSR